MLSIPCTEQLYLSEQEPMPKMQTEAELSSLSVGSPWTAVLISQL